MAFNPNELVIEKVRAVEEYDPATNELIGRFTQIEEPSLNFSADSTEVTDAVGTSIATFYNAQTGTFGFTNSLFSLDMAASQFGTEKEIASSDNKLNVPISEIVTISTGATVELKYTPVENTVKYVKVINENNTFGTTYEYSATAGDGKFTLSGKTITLPEGTTGRVFVQYERESAEAVRVSKTTDGVPTVKTLLIHVIFHDPCNTNLVYAGVVIAERAQPNIESVELSLTPDGKHSIEYKLQKPYCDETGKLVDIIVAEE